jgi:hypothetical protein
MMNQMSVESAYEAIAEAALGFVKDRRWDVVRAKHGILSSMVSSEWLIEAAGAVDETGDLPEKEVRRKATESIRFLRDDLLRTTGQRIWGLTFTLYPDGKFNIEYDYNKPEGYEETDEVITGDEINASLNRLNGQDKTPD